MDTLFSHVSIVTMDDRMSVWTDSFLGVTDGKISYLGKKAPEEQPQTIIDGSGMVLMPGLINCHTHLPMTILRGYADDLKLQEWLNDYIFPREAHLDEMCIRDSISTAASAGRSILRRTRGFVEMRRRMATRSSAVMTA